MNTAISIRRTNRIKILTASAILLLAGTASAIFAPVTASFVAIGTGIVALGTGLIAPLGGSTETV